MTYTKPQVTIDLEEYQELLAIKNKPTEDKEVMYKEVVFAVAEKMASLSNDPRGDIQDIYRTLSLKGIVFHIAANKHGGTSANLVTVERVADQKKGSGGE